MKKILGLQAPMELTSLRAESQHFASVHDDNTCVASIPYFGFIEEIWELSYMKFIVCVFKCKWVDSNIGVQTNDVGFTLVDLKKLAYQNDSFIMAQQAKQVFCVEDPCDERWQMATPPNSPPPPAPPTVHVDPAIEKAGGPHRKKLRTYLGIAARDKVYVTYENWKQVPAAQKDMGGYSAEFDIPEASNLRKKKIHQTMGERWRQFKSDLTSKWELAADKDNVNDTDVRKKAHAIQKQNIAPHMLSHGGYEYLENKLMEEKKKKQLEEASQSRSTDTVIDPPSPIRRHVKWKMAYTKKTGQMTFEAAKEIANKIGSHFKFLIAIIYVYYGSFIAHGRQDVLTATIGRLEHPGRVCVARADVMIKQYFGLAPRTSHTSLSMAPEDMEQLMQKIKDQLEESITEKGLTLPPEPEVGPSTTRVNTKESCVDPSGNDPDTGDSNKCWLYIEENPPRLVALGRLYEGSTTIHNIPLLHDQVKVGVEEVTEADAPILVPTEEAKLVGWALNTFLAWPMHLVKCLSKQGVVGPAKLGDMPDHDVDDPLYLMTLTIPQLFLKPLQVMWDATVFGVKHEDLSEIAQSGQCLNIFVIHLWILHMIETIMRVGNANVYGFLEPQSILRSG
ncbi:hypothetical protein GmHk_02G004882 [Glycine max]|nr:hypothetical protein GmHk_02G004882 [Glycine max]KAH1262207.1 hypothetical protein GmHk_02G004882 [Glycine max]